MCLYLSLGKLGVEMMCLMTLLSRCKLLFQCNRTPWRERTNSLALCKRGQCVENLIKPLVIIVSADLIDKELRKIIPEASQSGCCTMRLNKHASFN